MITLDDLKKLVTPKFILKSRPKGSTKHFKYYHPDGTWRGKKIGAAMIFEKDVPKALEVMNDAYPSLEVVAVRI